MWFLLSSVLLFAQPQSALQGGCRRSAQDDQLRRYRDESYLLSQPISASVFRNLPRLQRRHSAGKRQRAAQSRVLPPVCVWSTCGRTTASRANASSQY